MTDDEMLEAFEKGQLVRFRGARYRVVGIESGRPSSPGLVFTVVHAAILPGRDVAVEDATADECEPIVELFAPARQRTG